jgi:hypothetical protein
MKKKLLVGKEEEEKEEKYKAAVVNQSANINLGSGERNSSLAS